ncbi:uncharacterized protein LOC114727839 [Neltuma alba]|uniref:uncharacterized protein LOC114727839 n=1 Tax=Neltuma alba TaxID=207710 RepID=UPI0010A48030|nr:uncharacterized protein LOC114727839 [Prosopis alba]
MGFTGSDIGEGVPEDLKSLKIQVILMNNGLKSCKKETDIITQAPTSDAINEAVKPGKKKCWRKMVKHMGKWFKHNGEWLEKMRGNLSLVATVISTITFQSVISPPGSFIQQGLSNSNNTTSSPLDCLKMEDDYASPGKAVLAFRDSDKFRYFIIHNTVALVPSLGVNLLLISGLPLKNKIVIWMLSMGMCISLSQLGQAYFSAFFMITPDKLWDSTGKMLNIVNRIWEALFALVAGYILVTFLIWLFKKCSKIIKRIWMLTYCGRNRSYGNGCCCI